MCTPSGRSAVVSSSKSCSGAPFLSCCWPWWVWRLVSTSAKFFNVMVPGSGCHSLGCHGYASSQTTALISQMQIGWFDFDSLSFLTLSLLWVPSGTYRILLCLTPDNFIRQWGTPWEWKGLRTLCIAYRSETSVPWNHKRKAGTSCEATITKDEGVHCSSGKKVQLCTALFYLMATGVWGTFPLRGGWWW